MAAVASAYSQQVFSFSMDATGGNVSSMEAGLAVENKVIGHANLECFYDYRWTRDTTDTADGMRDDVMVLQIGDGLSKFFSYRTMKADSLIATVSSPDELLSDLGKFKRGETFSVYKNYPAGKQTFTDMVANNWYRYEDEVQIDWQIGDATKTIEGYQCRQTTCTFRGRDYTAWFTPEIPVSDGPWKFSGLPGLIMEVSDNEGHYSYVLTGLRQVDAAPVNMADVNYHKTNRKEYLSTKEKFETNPIGFMGLSGVTIQVMNPDGTPNNEAMEGKALKYSYQERDYK